MLITKFYTRMSFRLQTRHPTPIPPLNQSNHKRKSTRTPWCCLLTATLAIAQPRPSSHWIAVLSQQVIPWLRRMFRCSANPKNNYVNVNQQIRIVLCSNFYTDVIKSWALLHSHKCPNLAWPYTISNTETSQLYTLFLYTLGQNAYCTYCLPNVNIWTSESHVLPV